MPKQPAQSEVESDLLICELDQSDAIAFIEQCQQEGVSCSEKIAAMIQIFLGTGDNHLLKTA